jgi:hypothetical protein
MAPTLLILPAQTFLHRLMVAFTWTLGLFLSIARRFQYGLALVSPQHSLTWLKLILIIQRSFSSPEFYHYGTSQWSYHPATCPLLSAWPAAPQRLPSCGKHLSVLRDTSPIPRLVLEACARNGTARSKHWSIGINAAARGAHRRQGSYSCVPHMQRALCPAGQGNHPPSPQALRPSPVCLPSALWAARMVSFNLLY